MRLTRVNLLGTSTQASKIPEDEGWVVVPPRPPLLDKNQNKFLWQACLAVFCLKQYNYTFFSVYTLLCTQNCKSHQE